MNKHHRSAQHRGSAAKLHRLRRHPLVRPHPNRLSLFSLARRRWCWRRVHAEGVHDGLPLPSRFCQTTSDLPRSSVGPFGPARMILKLPASYARSPD